MDNKGYPSGAASKTSKPRVAPSGSWRETARTPLIHRVATAQFIYMTSPPRKMVFVLEVQKNVIANNILAHPNVIRRNSRG